MPPATATAAPKPVIWPLRVLHFLRRKIWWVVGLAIVLSVTLGSVPIYAMLAARSSTYDVATVPAHDIAIVFGAGLQPWDSQPSSYLRSRLDTAAALYKAGKVKVFLLSGDNGVKAYDEPTAMKNYLVGQGIPASALVLDYGGFGTYDTCYRAHEIFGVTSAILVTHGYHIPRAVMLCESVGIENVAVDANFRHNSYPTSYLLRETLALDEAAYQMVVQPQPKVLGPKVLTLSAALAAQKASQD